MFSMDSDGGGGGGPGIPDGEGPRSSGPADRVLIRRLLDGDQDAMRLLIDRYDRLVRYTIFKAGRRHCQRDPGWLDARANEAWTGIVQSLRRAGANNAPPNAGAYFARIARNKCLDAAKRADDQAVIPFPEGNPAPATGESVADPEDNPLDLMESLEQIDALRGCIARLGEEDRVLCSEIELIMERKWSEAADRLGIAESTLRSRWQGVMGRLRACLRKKTEES
jgi:RNA polymerase sigma factor (sigma-70 family)